MIGRTILASIAAALALAGCGQAESQEEAGDFTVAKLFTHDGCTVYRFRDGYMRYFVRCENAATSSTQWRETCGKNCTRDVQIPTGATGSW